MQSFATVFSNSLFLTFIAGIPLFAYWRKVKVYESFIEGAKEGFGIVIMIIPYLVAMIVAIGMLRVSGAFDLLAAGLSPVLEKIGIPADVFPLALMRSFSGSASNGMAAEIMVAHGGDDYASRLAATLVGSTDTTFYVLAVYFGSVAIRKTRHAVAAGLVADLTSVVAAVFICSLIFSA
ncbi:MAG: nucleoside recognition domain-containing protein [Gammaproteobacteria bacterium]